MKKKTIFEIIDQAINNLKKRHPNCIGLQYVSQKNIDGQPLYVITISKSEINLQISTQTKNFQSTFDIEQKRFRGKQKQSHQDTIKTFMQTFQQAIEDEKNKRAILKGVKRWK